MKKRTLLVVALIAAFCPLTVLGQLSAKPADRTLQVKVNYAGTGVVTEKHQIYVLLADANPFTSATLIDAISEPVPPAAMAGVAHIVASAGTADKNGMVMFRELAVSAVYVIAVVDKNGGYNGHLDSLPLGTPTGAFGNVPDKLEAVTVEAGKTSQITLAFDDSSKAP